MCDRMLQDSLRCYRDPGPGRGVGRGFGLAECGEARVCGGAGRGLAGWDGDSGPGRGVCGDSGPGAGWGGDSGRGAEWGGDSGPGCGVGIRARARGGMGIRAPARSGDFFGKMGNFLPFCRFFAVWVEICISSRLCMILNITPTQQIRIPVKIIHIVI